MNYHNITRDDMLNGEGLRVVLWVSGCGHHCPECHNPQTWDADSGVPFDYAAKLELLDELSRDYIAGITFSGGDPLFPGNSEEFSQQDDMAVYWISLGRGLHTADGTNV